MKTLGNLGSLAFLASLAACATADPVGGDFAPEETHEPIIGGTEDTGDSAVAALFGHKPGESTGGLCTATLISPTWLVTAAHCVDPAVAGEGNVYEVRFAPNARQTPADHVVAVRNVYWDHAFDSANLPGGHDIAVVELEHAAPAGIVPMPYIKQTIPSSLQGGQVRLVGYGLDDGFDQNGESAGIKRQVSVTLNTIGDWTLAVGQLGQTSCNGDSGGPAFAMVDGKETIVGVTSYGFIFCIAAANYTRVDLFHEWVTRTIGGSSCTPSCDGKQCGGDGCTGSCGECGSGETCTGGACVPSSGGCPGETEANDDAGHAQALCRGDSVLGTISSSTDQDWFTIDVPRNTTYTVLIDEVSNEFAFTLYKKSTTSGNLMKVDDARLAGGVLVLSKRTATGGTYYVQVRGVDGATSSKQYGLYLVK